MSKRNREKRKWKCAKCGERMHAALAKPAQKMVDDAKVRDRRIIHLCGTCKALRYEEGGFLRLLTPSEEFKVRMEIPKKMAKIDAMKLVPKADFGLLEFASE